MEPLKHLFKRTSSFHWTTNCELTFEELRVTFIQGPILIPLDRTKEIHVHIDESAIAIRVVLTQG